MESQRSQQLTHLVSERSPPPPTGLTPQAALMNASRAGQEGSGFADAERESRKLSLGESRCLELENYKETVLEQRVDQWETVEHERPWVPTPRCGKMKKKTFFFLVQQSPCVKQFCCCRGSCGAQEAVANKEKQTAEEDCREMCLPAGGLTRPV